MEELLGKRKKQSVQLIITALYELLNKQNYEIITISKICTKAGVSRNTFYRLFSSKEEVLEYMLKEKIVVVFRKYDAEEKYDILNPTIEDIRRVYLRYYNFWFSEKDFLRILNKRELFSVFHEMHCKYFVNQGSEKVISYLEKPGQYEEYYYRWQSSGLSNILQVWAKRDFLETPEELAEMTIRLHSLNNYLCQL